MDRRYARWQELFEQMRAIEALDSQAPYEKAIPCFYQVNSEGSVDSPEIGTSRKGGLPDLPESISWPVDKNGQAMTFLAQVNFSELEPGFAPYLPERGWSYFFIGRFKNWLEIPHRVIYYDGPAEALRQTSLPQTGKSPERIYAPYPLSFEPGFTLYGEFLDELFKNRSVDKLFTVVHELFQAEITRVGGHPMSFQSFSESQAYLALSGFDLMYKYGSSIQWHEFRIQRNGWESKRPEHVAFLRTKVYAQIREYEQNIEYHKERMKALRPIFILDSDDDMQWGDLGFLQFFIFQEDLEQRDFSRTWCDLTST